MGDYPPTEQLTRLIALERMKKLSDMYIEAMMNYDAASARMYDQERKELKKEFFKVVK